MQTVKQLTDEHSTVDFNTRPNQFDVSADVIRVLAAICWRHEDCHSLIRNNRSWPTLCCGIAVIDVFFQLLVQICVVFFVAACRKLATMTDIITGNPMVIKMVVSFHRFVYFLFDQLIAFVLLQR